MAPGDSNGPRCCVCDRPWTRNDSGVGAVVVGTGVVASVPSSSLWDGGRGPSSRPA